jgi:hypothetical protein
MKTFAEITVDHENTLAAAAPLRFWAHWLIGGVLFFIAMLIENPSHLLATVINDPFVIAIGFVSFGLITGIISKVLLMPLIPAPYAWLAKRLGLASPSV